MSVLTRHTVSITTDASGDGTGFTPIVMGRVINVIYTKDGTTPYDNGVDFTITLEASGQAVWTGTDVNATVTVAPRQATHDTVGAASLYAAAGEPVEHLQPQHQCGFWGRQICGDSPDVCEQCL